VAALTGSPQWGSPTKFSFPPLRKWGMRRFGISKVLSINFFYGILHVFSESSIKVHKFLRLGGDPRPSSGGSAFFSLQEREAESLLYCSDQGPGFAVSHAHLVGCLMERLRLINPSQQLVGSIPKGLPMVIEPDFIGDLHYPPPQVHYSFARITVVYKIPFRLSRQLSARFI